MSTKFLVGSLSLVLLMAAGLTFASDEVDNVMSRLMLSHRNNNILTPLAQSGISSSGRATATPSYADCGVANDKAESKITGGEKTAPNEFPWQAILVVKSESDETHQCGGSLIADRWILTSVSCLEGPPGQKLKEVNVSLGAHNISAPSEANRKEYWGNETFIHPNWNPATKAGDIALVKLSTVVEYTKYIHPICLPNPSEPDYVNQNVTVTGFAFDVNDWSDKLYKINVTVASNSDCNATYDNDQSIIMTDQMMCATGAADSEICKVDEGNPIMVKQTDGRYKQIGIVLQFYRFSDFCHFREPFAYTRLSSYSSWVNNITSPASSQTSSSTTIASTTPTTPTTSTSPSSSATIQTSPAILLLVSLISFSMNF
ncbi:elastase-1-like [Daphnia pulicaria]|uniref:elastase-1-like n=1 Tax=Daphnia pulicaria TaxID=35523 RepID=UPI001EEA63CB|nr:elastase-1-like [Daphnia pulicaria]